MRSRLDPWGAITSQESEVTVELELMWVVRAGCMSVSAGSRVGRSVGSGLGRRVR